MAEQPTIEVADLTKRFGNFTAVDSISFHVDRREIFGLLGPNGAGKTTTIRCLLTLIKPTSGSIKVSGINALKNPQQVRQLCGYVPQEVSVDGDLTGYENLLLYAKLYGIPRTLRKGRIEEALKFMGLADRANSLVKTYSGGMMRRLEIAQVLVNQPRVLFLDEPSIGLDPAAKRMIWDYIVRLRDGLDATILLTTHDMLEADELCDRIAIMNLGKIVVTGSPEQLKANLGGDVVSIATTDADCASILSQLGYQLLARSSNCNCDLVINNGEQAIPRILEELKRHGVTAQSVSLKRATLDDVFLSYAGTRIDESETTWRTARLTRRTIRRLRQ
jgi:ABC-2 type transport system ATP-binding protein